MTSGTGARWEVGAGLGIRVCFVRVMIYGAPEKYWTRLAKVHVGHLYAYSYFHLAPIIHAATAAAAAASALLLSDGSRACTPAT